jgi:nucleoside-diphosphate-sugar epimerase
MSGELVVVTGGSGFIGAHCILQALQAGYRARATLRSLARESYARELIGSDERTPLSFAAADLLSDEGWAEAVIGADYVLHVASPFPTAVPRHEDELIVPAREGTLRVLRAARDAGVRRTVVTSSFAAIGYGHRPSHHPFTEESWTDPTSPHVTAYVKSKTVAERAAWDFIDREGGPMQLAVVNPVGVFGPVLGPDYSSSIEIVRRLLVGAMPGIPRMYINVVDVRDVADLHLRAMTDPAAAGQRFLAVAGEPVSMVDIAHMLRENLGAAARKVPTRVLPNPVVRLGALFDRSIRQIVPELDRPKRASADKARRMLGWVPRSNQDALLATAASLLA